MRPLVSIIIPVFNREKEFRVSLASALMQTYDPIEYIVVDDGSKKPIEPIITGQRKNQVHFFRQENKGAPAARNRGFEESHGEFVIFWDADIVAKKDMIETMVKKLEASPDAAWVYANFLFGRKKMRGRVFDAKALLEQNYIATTSLMRRNDFPGFDESLKRFQDWDLWLTLSQNKKKGVWIDKTLFRCIAKGTMSSWLPSFAYKSPWKYLPWWQKKVRAYEQARTIIQKKHEC